MDEPITFGTDGWRATLEDFTEPRVRMVGQAVATYLSDHGLSEMPVGIAYDSRETSSRFADALADVLMGNGIDVIRTARDTPTPVLAWMIANEGLAGGLMVTASHNPPEYNGVKFITAAGAPALPPVTEAIESRLGDVSTVPASKSTTVTETDPIDAYLDSILPLTGSGEIPLRISYDAMHGSGRGVTDRALRQSGAAVNTFRCTQDPTFGGAAPEPCPEHLGGLTEAVTSGEADLGIANDGDADRIAVITPSRGYLDENLLFAALYEYLLETRSGPAVRTVSTSTIVDRVAEAHGENVIETPVGFKWVARAMRDYDALIGGEESGGFSIRNHVREKDGVLLALLVAAMCTEEPLDDRVDRLLDAHGPVVQDKTAISCPDDRKVAVIGEIGEVLPEQFAGVEVEDVSQLDGYKITLTDGSWMLFRPSGTEPKLRVYAEGSSEERVAELLDAGRELVERMV